ncbi:mRNA decay activator ZFP36L2-like [Pelobates cultripes]|uniref:mRNA decay activator protein ZFP36 n=1 Tax=Pelobates cultripes TaxID=61616 RepID=A0AAD1WT19_PELCU|nr:mRNA decay activator ZFP36L2-like [Pelobates cultripes]
MDRKEMLLELTGGLDLFSAFLPTLSSPCETDAPLLPSFSVTSKVPGLTSLRYKTELCTRYAESGFCAYKSRCQFAHGLSELRPLLQHPKYKTELCRSFHVLGTCNYGLRCLFIHNLQERREPLVSPTVSRLPQRRHVAPYNKQRCRLWRSPAGCPYGARCHFQHPKGVQEACRHYAALGDCPYGSRCYFSHNQPPDRWGTGGKKGSDCLSPSDPDSEPGTPLFSDSSANNAFTFSSLLLPLALRLQILGEEDFSGLGDPVLTEDENSQGTVSD